MTGGFEPLDVTVGNADDGLGLDETGIGVRVGFSDETGCSEDMTGLRAAPGVTVEDADGPCETCCGEGSVGDTEGEAGGVSTPVGDELTVVFGVTVGSFIA